MHIPRLFRKPMFWGIALVAFAVFAVAFTCVWHYKQNEVRQVLSKFGWTLMIFESPDRMEPAPF